MLAYDCEGNLFRWLSIFGPNIVIRGPQGQTFDAPTLRAGCNSVVVHWRVLRQHASAATMHGKVDQ